MKPSGITISEEIPAKCLFSSWKWIVPLCVALGLAAWWYFRPVGHAVPAMVLIPAGDFQMGDQSMPKGIITVSGGEGDDAKTYQERQVTKAIADSKSAE